MNNGRILALALAIFACISSSSVYSATFTIDGTTRLNTITVPNSGATHIRFTGAGYQNPGSLTLSGNGSDSLIFEQATPSDSGVNVNGVLLHLLGQNGIVVFRGLFLKLSGAGALFDTNQSGNHNLLFDSCTVLGDTVTKGKVLAWGGDGASNITVSNSLFSSTGAISLTGADTITLSNNLFNYTGVLTANTTALLEMKYNTTNRTQFLLDGNFSATCVIQNNYFANPPAKNNLAQGGTQRFVAFFKGGSFLSTGSSLTHNSRYATWDGFDFFPPGTAMFSDTSNITVTPAKDSAIAWDWKIAGDTMHGAWNGSKPLPAFNLFPPDSTLSLSLPGGSAVFALNASPFPRLVSAAFGATAYATSLPDSIRSWFGKDTTLVLGGSGTLRSLTLPSRPSGRPVLFAKTGSSFAPGSIGPDGSTTFTNGSALAREFLPALSGQNTFRGSAVSVKGLSTDTTFRLDSVTRAGVTTFSAPTLSSSNKRWRVLRKAGKPLGFRDTTTAEGNGNVIFGFLKAGVDIPFTTDSLSWWRGAAIFSPVTDSGVKFLGTVPFASETQALLLERLAIGAGRDTVTLAQGKVITVSAIGHQLKIDSNFIPNQSQFPDQGAFSSHGLFFFWPGRVAGDSLYLVLNKTDSLQQAFVKMGSKDTLVKPVASGSAFVTLALDPGDTGKTFFLARQYPLAAGVTLNLTFGRDSVQGLLSGTPGSFALDSAAPPTGLDLTQARLLGSRNIHVNNLQVQGTYRLSFDMITPLHKDSVRVYVYDGSAWSQVAKPVDSTRCSVLMGGSIQSVAVIEGLLPQQVIPPKPALPPTAALSRDTLRVTPNLSADEKISIQAFKLEAVSIDLSGKVVKNSSGFLSVGSSAVLALTPNVMGAYRVIYQSYANQTSLDTAWVVLPTRTFSDSAVQNLAPKRNAKFKYLIGFPFAANYNAHVKAGYDSWTATDSAALDTVQGNAWDPLPLAANPALRRGAGYLFAATRPYQAQVGSAALPGLVPDTLRLDIGWRLVSDPFPFPFADANIQMDSSAISMFLSLRRDTASSAKSAYTWDTAKTLQPFEGYLVYVFKQTSLVFDPLRLPANALNKMAASLSYRLVASDGASQTSVTWFTGNRFRSTPAFAAFGNGIQLKTGNGNFLERRGSLDSVTATFILFSPRGGRVSLLLDASGTPSPDLRLLDKQSGRLYRGDQIQSVDVASGTNEFELFLGSTAYVERQASEFLSGLPTAFNLGQNFPNPFVGTTQLRYSIPASLGRVLNARLDVVDLNGKSVQSLSLGSPTLGEHRVTLGKGGWKPGLYIARLTVRAESMTATRVRKMMVGTVTP